MLPVLVGLVVGLIVYIFIKFHKTKKNHYYCV